MVALFLSAGAHIRAYKKGPAQVKAERGNLQVDVFCGAYSARFHA
jgi:hypothetical protein